MGSTLRLRNLASRRVGVAAFDGIDHNLVVHPFRNPSAGVPGHLERSGFSLDCEFDLVVLEVLPSCCLPIDLDGHRALENALRGRTSAQQATGEKRAQCESHGGNPFDHACRLLGSRKRRTQSAGVLWSERKGHQLFCGHRLRARSRSSKPMMRVQFPLSAPLHRPKGWAPASEAGGSKFDPWMEHRRMKWGLHVASSSLARSASAQR